MEATTTNSGTASKRMSKPPSRRGKGLPRRAQDLSKEELLLTLKKKKECNAKALQIVEGMLECKVQEEWFLGVLQHINQSHLQDISEERAITGLCGYSLCSHILKNIPSQQYRISTKLNKVYDITERKNFCSNKCFKAFKYIKDQMHTSPLWLRDIEPKVQFGLMPATEGSGGVGDEVNVQVERVSKEEVKQLAEDPTTRCEDKKSPSSEAHLLDAINNLQNVASLRLSQGSHYVEQTDHPAMEKCNHVKEMTTSDMEEAPLTGDAQHMSSEGLGCLSSGERSISREKSESSEKTRNNHSSSVSDCALVEDKEVLNHPEKSSCAVKTLDQHPDQSNKSDDIVLSQVGKALKAGHKSEPCPSSICLTHETRETLFSEIERAPVQEVESKSERSPSCNVLSKSELHKDLSATKPLYKTRAQSETNNIAAVETVFKTSSVVQKIPGGTQKEERKYQKSALPMAVSSNTFPPVAHVEKCVREWFTIETMCFLFGESALKDMLEQKGESIQEYYKALSTLTCDQEKHERFLAICKRLSLLEIEDKNFDSREMKSEAESKRKPLPDYSALKREAETMELKINAFYKGKMEIDERKVSFADNVKNDSTENEIANEPQLPLVHTHSQRALRKKIVLDGLNRVLPDFLRTFGTRPSELTSSVRGLIGTFALSPTNITFKPPEWSLLGLVVIKLLAIREPELKQCLQSEQSSTYLTLMLMSYKQEPGYLDRLLSWLTDINKLLAQTSI